MGGAETARAFLQAGAVDELRLTLVPVLLGSGVALFGADGGRRELDLIESNERGNGLVEVRYAVDA